MDVLTDDHEREQVVRKWWSENWLSLTVGVAIALSAMVGYKYYNSYQNEKAQAYAYELTTLKTKLALKPTEAKPQVEAFFNEHKDIYGSLLSLELAASNAVEGKYEEALKNASFAKENGGKLIAPNAAIMKAHLYTQLNKFDEAVAELSSVNSDAYAVEKYELEGDINLAKGNKEAALASYKKAIEECESKKIQINTLLQMKADSLRKDGDKPAFERASALAEDIAASASTFTK